LAGRGFADSFGLQEIEPVGIVKTSLTHESAIDDASDTLDRKRSFGYVRAEDHASLRTGREYAELLFKRKRAMKNPNFAVSWNPRSKPRPDLCVDLTDFALAGQKNEHIAGLV
jgi:hypothetical protein